MINHSDKCGLNKVRSQTFLSLSLSLSLSLPLTLFVSHPLSIFLSFFLCLCWSRSRCMPNHLYEQNQTTPLSADAFLALNSDADPPLCTNVKSWGKIIIYSHKSIDWRRITSGQIFHSYFKIFPFIFSTYAFLLSSYPFCHFFIYLTASSFYNYLFTNFLLIFDQTVINKV